MRTSTSSGYEADVNGASGRRREKPVELDDSSGSNLHPLLVVRAVIIYILAARFVLSRAIIPVEKNHIRNPSQRSRKEDIRDVRKVSWIPGKGVVKPDLGIFLRKPTMVNSMRTFRS